MSLYFKFYYCNTDKFGRSSVLTLYPKLLRCMYLHVISVSSICSNSSLALANVFGR